jgi:hypothetical protein
MALTSRSPRHEANPPACCGPTAGPGPIPSGRQATVGNAAVRRHPQPARRRTRERATQRADHRSEPGDRSGDRRTFSRPRRQGFDDLPQRAGPGPPDPRHRRRRDRHRDGRGRVQDDRGAERPGRGVGGERRHHPGPAPAAHDRRRVRQRAVGEPRGRLQVRAPGQQEHVAAQARPDRAHRLRRRAVRLARPGQLLVVEVGTGRHGALAHPGDRLARHHRQRRGPRFHRHVDDRGAAAGAPGRLQGVDPRGPVWSSSWRARTPATSPGRSSPSTAASAWATEHT